MSEKKKYTKITSRKLLGVRALELFPHLCFGHKIEFKKEIINFDNNQFVFFQTEGKKMKKYIKMLDKT
jgi:hypothetical protein